MGTPTIEDMGEGVETKEVMIPAEEFIFWKVTS
jgi:hypothetical protein